MNDWLNTLDRHIAAVQQQLTALIAARDATAAAMNWPGPSTASEIAPAARVVRRTKKAAPPKRGKKASKPARQPRPGRELSDRELDDKVLAFLQRQNAPVRTGQIDTAVKCSRYQVNIALERLEHAGEVVKVGRRAGTRVGTPSVMKNTAAKEEP